MNAVSEALTEHIGHHGRMLHGSKQAKPGHEVYWNACGFTEDGAQVWWGDVDLTAEGDRVQAAADACGETILITPEQPFRFSGINGERKEDRERIRRFTPAERSDRGAAV